MSLNQQPLPNLEVIDKLRLILQEVVILGLEPDKARLFLPEVVEPDKARLILQEVVMVLEPDKARLILLEVVTDLLYRNLQGGIVMIGLSCT